MFGRLFVRVMSMAFLLAGSNAQASFHLWQINEVYSNASGTIQFIEFTTTFGSQQFLANHDVTSSNGVTTKTYTFTTNLPGDSANRKFLMATSGFAALGIVAPDYIIPDGFLFTSNLTLSLVFADTLSNVTLPTDGVLSLNRNATTGTNSPTNFAGATGSILPPSPPGPPVIGTATAGIGQASVTFTAPGSDGGSAITGYSATCGTQTATGTVSPIVVSGLSPGVSVTCTVRAGNAQGLGVPSAASNSVTPPDVPGAPALTAVTAGNTLASASFTPPAGDGGSPITGYSVQCSAPMQTTRTATGKVSPIVVTGMTNEVTYTCSVAASNAAGSSAASNQLMVTPSVMIPLALIDVQSRKTHSAAGTFELPIATGVPITGAVTVESRQIGSGHLIAFQFNTPISSVGSLDVTDAAPAPVGNASFAIAGNIVLVTLSGLPDNQRVTVALTGINGSLDISAAMGFLVGDINGTGAVTASDIIGVKSQLGRTTTLQNFRVDVNATGAIAPSAVPAVKARAGQSLQ